MKKINWIKVLKKDVSEFNKKRLANDFRPLDLSNADLKDTDLTGANLDTINLTDTDLTNANLTDVSLKFCRLVRTNFKDSNLTESNLYCANLTDANLEGTNLQSANLSETNLRRVNLKGALLNSTDLTEANLTGAKLPDAPVVDNLFTTIQGALENGGELDLDEDHVNELIHSLAGWIVHVAGDKGYALENEYGVVYAATLIVYNSCNYLNGIVPDFFSDYAMDFIEDCADKEFTQQFTNNQKN